MTGMAPTAVSPEVSRYTPSMPKPGVATRNPASVGPTIWVLDTVSWVSDTAFDSSSRLTTSPVMATRAGPMKANDDPWITDTTRSIQNSSRSINTMIPSHRALVVNDTWAHKMMARREKRSAATPPNGMHTIMPTAKANITAAKARLEPVSSMASQLRASICMPTAKNATTPDQNSLE